MKTKGGYYFYVGLENDIRQYASTKNRVEKKSLPQIINCQLDATPHQSKRRASSSTLERRSLRR